ncbi:MAG: tRNA lysidine(34) synthetase TilS [Alphaproteobacteria bacterium]
MQLGEAPRIGPARREAGADARAGLPLARHFARAMASLGPFEDAPALAVAVSGGPDSMALCLLAEEWAAGRGGTLIALIVDHGLRTEAAAEARQVARWLKRRGIAARVLRWRGEKPTSGLQAAARVARYNLLTAWCRRHGVLHLLLGHQRDDQAETLLMRLERGSGPDGLAGMPRFAERQGVRLLRPLLAVPRERLVALLGALGQPFVEDPSNLNPAFGRVRLRLAMARHELPDAATLCTLARRAGDMRAGFERERARLLARAVRLDPAGHAWLRLSTLGEAPEALAASLIGAVIATVGGADHPPAPDSLSRLAGALKSGTLGAGATLGGCRIVPRRGGLLVCREPKACAPGLTLSGEPGLRWDSRFARLGRAAKVNGATLGALGAAGVIALRRQGDGAVIAPLPAPARPSRPAFRYLDGSLRLPHLSFDGRGSAIAAGKVEPRVGFRPRRCLAEAPFEVGGVASSFETGV